MQVYGVCVIRIRGQYMTQQIRDRHLWVVVRMRLEFIVSIKRECEALRRRFTVTLTVYDDDCFYYYKKWFSTLD